MQSIPINLVRGALIIVFVWVLWACGSGSDAFEDSSSSLSDSDAIPGGGSGHHTNHCAMTPDFMDRSLATHIATKSGPWSDAATWGGTLPDHGAFVLVPQGVEVTIDHVIEARLEALRIDGSLNFLRNQTTELKVDTLFSNCGSRLQIGTRNAPIDASATARVVFIDDGPVTDTNRLSRGAILLGQTHIAGMEKTHRASLSPHALAGDTTLQLTALPNGWAINDQLVITGTQMNNPRSDEIRRISGINGTVITLDEPLNLDHQAPRADLNVYVANTTRNVEFVSENPALLHRGHIMIMNADTYIGHTLFTELGRTDKTEPLDDAEFEFLEESNGDDAPARANVKPLGGENVRGRYALHFHRNGTLMNSQPALVKGSVVFNGPGWGFVNHSSHVDFIDNVSYGLQGAGFYTEAGDELGRMEGNIAIRSVNASFTLDHLGAIDPDLGANRMDYGNDGDGFWLTGTRVSLINNVSAGASAHGFIYWTDGIMESDANPAVRTTIPVSNLPNGHLIPDRVAVPVWWAPFAENRGNESYGATIGFRSRYVHAKHYLGRNEESNFHRSPPSAYIDTLNPLIQDLDVWGSRDGVLLNYNERISLVGATILGFGKENSVFRFNDGTAKTGVGLDVGNAATHGPARIENVSIDGFGMGFVTPVNGQWEIRNLSLSGHNTDILVQEVETEGTEVLFENVTFDSLQIQENPGSTALPEHIVESP